MVEDAQFRSEKLLFWQSLPMVILCLRTSNQVLASFTEPMNSNTTGVHGVAEIFYSTRSGERVLYFRVIWAPRTAQLRNKRFYIQNYNSREDALQAAVEFRKDKEREILAQIQAG